MPGERSALQENIIKHINDINGLITSQKDTLSKREMLILNNLGLTLKEITKKTREMSETNKNGTEKIMSEDDFEELKKKYSDAASLCAKSLYEKDPKGNAKVAGSVEVVDSICESLAKDMRALDNYEKKGKSLSVQQMFRESNIPVINIGKENLGTVGANLSKRIPFSYTKANGKKLEGVFTPKKIMDVPEEFNQLMEEAGNISPDFKEFMQETYNAYNSYTNGAEANQVESLMNYSGILTKKATEDKKAVPKTDAEFVDSVMKIADQAGNKNPELKNKILESYDKAKKDPKFDEALNKFNTDLRLMGDNARMNLKSAHIGNKSRIDSRNSAMSEVANMLGKSNLVAQSVPMTIKYGDKTIEGTFMKKGKGMDREHPTKASLNYTTENFKTKGLASFSDLLVLDYICGNVDRHMSNMLYQFDTTDKEHPENHKFTGVQGIDNDCSFGTVTGVDKINQMNSLDQIQVISKSMRDAIDNIDPATFMVKLRGFGLNKEQIDAVGVRLNNLQEKLRTGDAHYRSKDVRDKLKKENRQYDKGFLKTVRDEDFSKLDIDKLADLGGSYGFLKGFGKNLGQKDIDGKGLNLKQVNRQLGFSIDKKETQKITDDIKAMKDNTGIRGSSKEYKDLQASLAKYEKFCKASKGDTLNAAQYETRNSMLKEIQTNSLKYLAHKGVIKLDPNNPDSFKNAKFDKEKYGKLNSYETNRVNLVSKVAQDSVDMLSKADKNLYRNLIGKMNEEEKGIFINEQNKTENIQKARATNQDVVAEENNPRPQGPAV